MSPDTLGTMLNAYPGLANIVSQREVKAFREAGPEEQGRQLNRFRQEQRDLNLTKGQTQGYQEFDRQLDLAGKSIRRAFIVGLEPLVTGQDGGPLGQLSKASVHLVDVFMKAVKDGKWIETLTGGLNDFSTEIGKPEFGQSVKDFVENIGTLASWIKWAASFLPKNDNILGPPQDVAAAKAVWDIGRRFLSSEPMSMHDVLLANNSSMAVSAAAEGLKPILGIYYRS